MAVTPASTFVEQAVQRCSKHGVSLRAVALTAGLSPSMFSQMRTGEIGVPLERVENIAQGLGLSEAERATFLNLVRSDRARRAIKGGTDYVVELEGQLQAARQSLAEVLQWMESHGSSPPEYILQPARAVLGDEPDPATEQLADPRWTPGPRSCRPWPTQPTEDRQDLDELEARDENGLPTMAEYRLRVRDADGMLIHGDIFIAKGVTAAIDLLMQRYRLGAWGTWPAGWYLCDVIRKAAPSAEVRIACLVDPAKSKE